MADRYVQDPKIGLFLKDAQVARAAVADLGLEDGQMPKRVGDALVGVTASDLGGSVALRYFNDDVSSSITNTATETAFDTAEYEVPADQLQAGDLIQSWMYGTYTAGGMVDGTCTFRLSWNGTELHKLGVCVGTGGSSIHFSIRALSIVRADGESIRSYVQSFQFGSNVCLLRTPSLATGLDMTIANTLAFTAQWQTASALNVVVARGISYQVSRTLPFE